jgi:hypothetical protein
MPNIEHATPRILLPEGGGICPRLGYVPIGIMEAGCYSRLQRQSLLPNGSYFGKTKLRLKRFFNAVNRSSTYEPGRSRTHPRMGNR